MVSELGLLSLEPYYDLLITFMLIGSCFLGKIDYCFSLGLCPVIYDQIYFLLTGNVKGSKLLVN
jgi:hypothetical protein